jgi:hypothetical protein
MLTGKTQTWLRQGLATGKQNLFDAVEWHCHRACIPAGRVFKPIKRLEKILIFAKSKYLYSQSLKPH